MSVSYSHPPAGDGPGQRVVFLHVSADRVSSMESVCRPSRTLRSLQLAEGRGRREANAHTVTSLAFCWGALGMLSTGHTKQLSWPHGGSFLKQSPSAVGSEYTVPVRTGTCLPWVQLPSLCLGCRASETIGKGASDVIWLSPQPPTDG